MFMCSWALSRSALARAAAYRAGVTARQGPARWWRRERDEAQAALAEAQARSAMSFYDLDAVQRRRLAVALTDEAACVFDRQARLSDR